MFGIADYGAFVAAIVVFLLIPGPGNLALITSTGKGGVRGGLAATFGVIAGDQVLMWLAVAGVAALLAAYPAAFAAVQWLGAAYLAWLGWKMLSAKPGDAPVLNIRPRQYFQQAFTITLLNPKAIVFYMAFFPLFVDPARHQGLLTFGAMAATVREVQTLSMPVTMMQLMVFFLAAYTITQPGSAMELFAIVFPLSSPFAMLARAAMQEALWVHAAALAWQALMVLLIVKGGSTLFRKRVMKSGAGGRDKPRRRLFGAARA